MTRERLPGVEQSDNTEASPEPTSADPRLRLAMQRRVLQRKADRDAKAGPRPEVPESGGAPLASDVKKRVEPHVGADMSKVRVHTGGESADAAKQIGARAFTDGDNVHFANGAYSPGTKEGDRLLVHELAHVAQGPSPVVQRKEDPDGKDASKEDVSQPGDPKEKEADAVADKAAGAMHGDGEKKDGDEKKEGEGPDKEDAKKEVEMGATGMPDKPAMYQDMMQVSAEFASKFEPFGLQLGPEILLAIARQESGKGLNPNQISFDHGEGLMQITPSKDGKLSPAVAEALGWDNTKSIAENEKAGAWKSVLGNLRAGALTMLGKVQYLAGSKKTKPIWATMKEDQRWRAVMFAYNAGEGSAAKALEAGGADAKMISHYTDPKGKKVSHDYTAEAQGNLDYVDKHDPFAKAEAAKKAGKGGDKKADAADPKAAAADPKLNSGPGAAEAGPLAAPTGGATPEAEAPAAEAAAPEAAAPAAAAPAAEAPVAEAAPEAEAAAPAADAPVAEAAPEAEAPEAEAPAAEAAAPEAAPVAAEPEAPKAEAPAAEAAAPATEAKPEEEAKADPAKKKDASIDAVKAGGEILKLHSSGEAVAFVQQKLGLPADGKYGPATHAAVLKFQEKKGLSVDGEVGKHTIAALEKEGSAEV